MKVEKEFEKLLRLLNRNKVKYCIVGAYAVAFYGRPRYTKDIDIWIDPTPENVKKANEALAEFGSPYLLTINNPEEILQIGVEPNRIDILQHLERVTFSNAWESRITDNYGEIGVNWIDIDNLIRAKELIDHPRHKEDVKILQEVKKLHKQKE